MFGKVFGIDVAASTAYIAKFPVRSIVEVVADGTSGRGGHGGYCWWNASEIPKTKMMCDIKCKEEGACGGSAE